MLGQGQEQVELEPGQLERLPTYRNLMTGAVNPQFTVLQDALVPAAAQQRFDSGDDLTRAEGFGHVVVGPLARARKPEQTTGAQDG